MMSEKNSRWRSQDTKEKALDKHCWLRDPHWDSFLLYFKDRQKSLFKNRKKFPKH